MLLTYFAFTLFFFLRGLLLSQSPYNLYARQCMRVNPPSMLKHIAFPLGTLHFH